MTAEEAKAAGYSLEQLDPFRTALLFYRQRVACWHIGLFGYRAPTLDAALVRASVEEHERHLDDTGESRCVPTLPDS